MKAGVWVVFDIACSDESPSGSLIIVIGP